MTIIQVSREQLLERLNAQLPVAEKFDAENKRKHKAEEAESVRKFRAKLRGASKLTYEELTANRNRYSSYTVKHDRPECPAAKATEFRQALADLRLDTRQKLRLSDSSGGDNGRLFRLYAWDPTPQPELPSDVCS